MIRYENTLSTEEYAELRRAVDWEPLAPEQARAGLVNSDFIVSCRDGDRAVGCARIFWDKGYIAYLADVMVRPEYRHRGIGRELVGRCIAFVDGCLREGWRIKIVLVAAKGKEDFYRSFGFEARPGETGGAGMQLWRGVSARQKQPFRVQQKSPI